MSGNNSMHFPASLCWQVRGVVTFADEHQEPLAGTWIGLTHDQAEAKLDGIVNACARRRKFRGVRIAAYRHDTPSGAGVPALIARVVGR